MKLRSCVALVLLLLSGAWISIQAQKISIGVAPVFDGGGEDFGPAVVQHLTLFTYQDLLDSALVHPSLLSPGGVYSPLDTSWLVDYVHERPEMSLLLVATLKPSASPVKGRWSIPIEVNLLDAQSGDTLGTWTVSVEIDQKKSLLEYGQYAQVTPLAGQYDKYGSMVKKFNIAPSRDFEKQPLGKACAKLASEIRETLDAKLTALGKAKVAASLVPASVSAAASCPVHFRITYSYKHSASHSYMLLENGLDQSTNLIDGLATFTAPEGELLLQFSVNDTPYKLEKESLYQASTVHSCKYTNLTMDLGPGGDAHAIWKD